MSDVKEALSFIQAIDYSEVPQDDLPTFFRTAFQHAELAMNSVPAPPPLSDEFSAPASPNSAQTAADTVCAPIPNPLDDRYAELQKPWGKAIKNATKENPTNIAVYKTSSNDKHGSWFARRSIHQGLGFEKWKRCMQREFVEATKVKGGPGAGAVRGIGADRRLEKEEVPGVGTLEVWDLSAQFPGPTAPREFLELLLTSDDALTEASAIDQSSKKPPRHFLVISRPTTHPKAPEQSGIVRGTYESIEMIREMPQEGNQDAELNPVEWIMITRSEPGGGIPKFMVERGTPGSIVGDTSKFLDWACQKPNEESQEESVPDEEVEESSKEVEKEVGGGQAPSIQRNGATADRDASINAGSAAPAEEGGIISSLSNYVGTTASSFLPLFQTQDGAEDDDGSSSESEAVEEDDDHFTSADEGDEPASSSVATLQPKGHRREFSTDNTSIKSAGSAETTQSISAALANGKEPANSHEKELLKMQKKRAELEEKLTKNRESEKVRVAAETEKEQKEQAKAIEKHEKEKQKQEQKYQKELAKLEEKRVKEEKKAEEKRKKAMDKDVLGKTTRERDEARQRYQVAETENAVLKKQVDELLAEKSDMLAKITEAEAQVQIMGGRARAASTVGSVGKVSLEK